MRLIPLLLATLCLVSVGASSSAEEPVKSSQLNIVTSEESVSALAAEITVEIKNANFIAITTEAENSKLRDLYAAAVFAGGTQIQLDVSDNLLAKQELILYSVVHHGDLRVPKLSVSGTLEYRLIKKQSKKGKEVVGTGTLVPVIVVKSLRVGLIDPGQQLPSGLFQPIRYSETRSREMVE